MKITTLFLPIVFIFLLFSCKKNDENFDPENYLIGKWYRQGLNSDSLVTYSRNARSGYDENFYMLIQNGSKYSFSVMNGYCASPPSYSIIGGTWKQEKSKLIVEYEFNESQYWWTANPQKVNIICNYEIVKSDINSLILKPLK